MAARDVIVLNETTSEAQVAQAGDTYNLPRDTHVIGALTGTNGFNSSGPTGNGIGYSTGAGAAVTQLTSRSTGVTINTLSGQITGDATSLAAGAEAVFTVTNSQVAIGDVPVIAVQSGPTPNTSVFSVSAVAAGSFDIKIHNLSAATADTGAPIINFAIIKAVAV